MKNESILTKLTIIIPTYNRQKYALRNMRYWSGRGATVHVLDGSEVAIESKELEPLCENVIYHHLPISFRERIQHGIDLTETCYTMMLGDDEFFIPSGLEKCIEELEYENDIVSCMGRGLLFSIFNGCLEARYAYKEMKDHAVLQNSSVKRLVHHMKPYKCSTVYSVVQTHVWKQAWSAFAKKEYPIYGIGELQFEMTVSYLGKSKVLPILTWLRSSENPSMANEPSFNGQTLWNWWNERSNLETREELLGTMADVILKNNNKNNPTKLQIESAFSKGFESYISQPEIDPYRNDIVNKIVLLLPKKLKKHLKQHFSYLRNKIRGVMDFMVMAEQLKETGVDIDTAELLNIERIIVGFHKK